VQHRSLRSRTPEDIFTEYYNSNFLGDDESKSGSGSNQTNTELLVAKLRAALDTLAITSLLGIPCGDFSWMKRVNLAGIDYTGGDIVEPLIKANNELYSSPIRSFRRLDLLADPLPSVDCIFCRDCLVHLSFADLDLAITNVIRSGARIFATTTYSSITKNYDIVTGDWRRLNLRVAPFHWPEPIGVILEQSKEADGAYADKSLAFWSIEQIQSVMRI
jgi:hypothetical protein